ncbi:ferredoxin [Lachnospiraceae bacterium PM6-15]|uniref:ferredoxin n=1 Tax=Ohessyouella blattaphilus TaxID=2949333 RepID=UPI003E1F9B6D
MKGLVELGVEKRCEACGLCVATSSLFEEDAFGYAKPTGLGILEDDDSRVDEIIAQCPVGAIQVKKIETTYNRDKKEAILKLKEWIKKNIQEFEPAPIKNKDVFFNYDLYKLPELLKHSKSYPEYRGYDEAKIAGLEMFTKKIYNQTETLSQYLRVEYKTHQLKNYINYKNEEGNYYHENNLKLSRSIEKAVLLGSAILGKGFAFPKNFFEIKIGPSVSYESSMCENLSSLEREGQFTVIRHQNYFKTYINVDDDVESGKYWYSLAEAEEEFKKTLLFDLDMKMQPFIERAMDELENEYKREIYDLVRKKYKLLVTKIDEIILKENLMSNDKQDINEDFRKLCNEIRKIEIRKEYVYRDVDMEYDDNPRFKSESKANDAASNRLKRFYDECRDYVGPNYSENISNHLSKVYTAQFEKILADMRNKIQIIFDKHSIKYPYIVFEIEGYNGIEMLDIGSEDKVSFGTEREIVEYIDKNILGYNGTLEQDKYIKFSDISHELHEDIDFIEGIFGEKEIITYGYYLYGLSDMEFEFYKVIGICCDQFYESEYIRKFRENMIKSLIAEIEGCLMKKYA